MQSFCAFYLTKHRYRYVSCMAHSTNAVITIAIQLRSDYDASRVPASIRHEQKMNMSVFRHSCIVVVLQSNRMQIIILITSVVVECIVELLHCSRIIFESQL